MAPLNNEKSNTREGDGYIPQEPRVSDDSSNSAPKGAATPSAPLMNSRNSSQFGWAGFSFPGQHGFSEKGQRLGQVHCPTLHDPFSRRHGFGTWIILILSIFSTGVSLLFVGLATKGNFYGSTISTNGKISASTAVTLTALFAKMVELSFVTVLVCVIGQYLSRRAFVQKGDGVTLGALTLRNWILQPGVIFTHFRVIWAQHRTFLPWFCLAVTIGATLYTTATSALVAPRLRFTHEEPMDLFANVSTSFANSAYDKKRCILPTMFSSSSDALGAETCTTMQYAARSYSDYEKFTTAWTTLLQNGNQTEDLRLRPPPSAMIVGSDTAHGQWVEIKDTAKLSKHWGRMVQNVSVAMPHSGVYAAAQHSDKILQPDDLDGQGSYRLDASVPSPVLNVLCANLAEDELKPLIFRPGNRSVTDLSYIRDWPMNLDFGPLNAYKVPTVVDELFEWGAKYEQHPPVFPRYPAPYNSILNTTFDYGRNAAYFLSNAPPASAWPHIEDRPYVLCKLQTYSTSSCFTRAFASAGKTTLTAICENNAPHLRTYSHISPLAPSGPSAIYRDWPTVGTHMLTSIALNTGISDANASISRLLALQTLNGPKRKDSPHDHKDDSKDKKKNGDKDTKRPPSLDSGRGKKPSIHDDDDEDPDTGFPPRNSSDTRNSHRFRPRQIAQPNGGFNPRQPSIAESLASMAACTLIVGNFDAPMEPSFTIKDAPPGNILTSPVQQSFRVMLAAQQYGSGSDVPYQRAFTPILYLVATGNVLVLIYILKIILFHRKTDKHSSIRKWIRSLCCCMKPPRSSGGHTRLTSNFGPSRQNTMSPDRASVQYSPPPNVQNSIDAVMTYCPGQDPSKTQYSSPTQYAALSPRNTTDFNQVGPRDDNVEHEHIDIIPRGMVLDICDPSNLFSLAINSPPSQSMSGSCGGGPSRDQQEVGWKVGRVPGTEHWIIADHTNKRFLKLLEREANRSNKSSFSRWRRSSSAVHSRKKSDARSFYFGRKQSEADVDLEMNSSEKIPAKSSMSPGLSSHPISNPVSPTAMPHMPGVAVMSDNMFGHSRVQSNMPLIMGPNGPAPDSSMAAFDSISPRAAPPTDSDRAHKTKSVTIAPEAFSNVIGRAQPFDPSVRDMDSDAMHGDLSGQPLPMFSTHRPDASEGPPAKMYRNSIIHGQPYPSILSCPPRRESVVLQAAANKISPLDGFHMSSSSLPRFSPLPDFSNINADQEVSSVENRGASTSESGRSGESYTTGAAPSTRSNTSGETVLPVSSESASESPGFLNHPPDITVMTNSEANRTSVSISDPRFPHLIRSQSGHRTRTDIGSPIDKKMLEKQAVERMGSLGGFQDLSSPSSTSVVSPGTSAPRRSSVSPGNRSSRFGNAFKKLRKSSIE